MKAGIWDRNQHDFNLYTSTGKAVLNSAYSKKKTTFSSFVGHRILSDIFSSTSMLCAADMAPGELSVLEISAVLFFYFTRINKILCGGSSWELCIKISELLNKEHANCTLLYISTLC